MKAIKGRGTGVPNYKNDILVNVVEAIVPIGPVQSESQGPLQAELQHTVFTVPTQNPELQLKVDVQEIPFG